MNRPMIKIAAIAMLAACCATSGDAYAANPPRGKFGTQTAARKQENDDMKRKLAPYLTDEGMSGFGETPTATMTRSTGMVTV